MKLLVKQYISSLRERDELDKVLPDILSEVGFNVLTRPMRGSTQYGVDVAAIGKHPSQNRDALYLLSIKSGNLTRSEWNEGTQALRPSLETILEVYIPKFVPKRYSQLPVVVVLCFGGDIQENVLPLVNAFIDKNTISGKLDFDIWNGDYIANLIASGLMRENIFPESVQSSFRKSVALVDEPSVCLSHFQTALTELLKDEPKNLKIRLRIARQIYLATWTIFVWCRDAQNLEAAYRCGEIALLTLWDISHKHFGGRSKDARELAEVIHKMVFLSRIIGVNYIEDHVKPYSEIEDALSVSVPSISSVDINLKLFEVLGRIAVHGLWLVHINSISAKEADEEFLEQLNNEIQNCVSLLCEVINNNKVLFTPLRDDHAIEITLASLFLIHCKAFSFLEEWIRQIALSSVFTHRSNGKYPCVFREYADLAVHPKYDDEYKQEATIGSILYPSLAVWTAILRDAETFECLAEFHRTDMKHSSWQFWLPDGISDEHLYRNTDIHGACLSDVRTQNGAKGLLDQLEAEFKASSSFYELSAMEASLWPIILIACRVYRLPIPPHFWVMRFD